MLSVLRRNAGSWAIKIILSFIALTFIWWGVGTYSEQDRNVAATVGGEAITTNELAEAVVGLSLILRLRRAGVAADTAQLRELRG